MVILEHPSVLALSSCVACVGLMLEMSMSTVHVRKNTPGSSSEFKLIRATQGSKANAVLLRWCSVFGFNQTEKSLTLAA